MFLKALIFSMVCILYSHSNIAFAIPDIERSGIHLVCLSKNKNTQPQLEFFFDKILEQQITSNLLISLKARVVGFNSLNIPSISFPLYGNLNLENDRLTLSTQGNKTGILPSFKVRGTRICLLKGRCLLRIKSEIIKNLTALYRCK
jgi:hypothetical protein